MDPQKLNQRRTTAKKVITAQEVQQTNALAHLMLWLTTHMLKTAPSALLATTARKQVFPYCVKRVLIAQQVRERTYKHVLEGLMDQRRVIRLYKIANLVMPGGIVTALVLPVVDLIVMRVIGVCLV